MAKVKTRIYTGSKQRTMESMLTVTQNTLAELGLEVTTQYLDKTLIECKGKAPPGSPLGLNIVTIYKEGDQIFIKFKYEMEEEERFWNIFESNLQIYGASTAEIEQKAKIVAGICKTVRGMGAQIDEEDVWDFLYNFEKTYQRLPTEEEFTPISMEYIKLMDELGLNTVKENEPVFVGDKPIQEAPKDEIPQTIREDGIEITPTDALKEIVKEITTLDSETKNFYLSLFNDLLLPDQERLVTKIKAIETDLNKIPYLLDDERKKLRREVMELSTEKRRERLLRIIKERQKNEPLFMAKFVEQQIKMELLKFPFLTKEIVNDIMNVILTMPFEQKKAIVQVVANIERKFQELIQQGIPISDIEKNNLRLEWIRLDEKERIETIEKYIENFRRQHVEEILFQEMPTMQFQDNKDIIKQLLWLSDSELRERIRKLRQDMDNKSQEKTKIFEGSNAGSACKKCGWPLSSMAKKCPRCGSRTDDWFDL